MMENNNRELSRRIARVRIRLLASTTAALLLVALGSACLLLVAVSLFFLSGWVLSAVLVVVLILARFWLRGTNTRTLGYRIEQRFPELKGRLVSALELLAYQPGVEGYSLELRNAAVAQVTALAAPLNFNAVIPLRRVWWSAAFALLSIALLGCFFGLKPDRAVLGLINGFSPEKVNIRFSVAPGDTSVLAGETVTVSCAVAPAGVFRSVILELAPEHPGPHEIRRLKLVQDRALLPLLIETSLSYRFRLLGRSSDWFSIRLPAPLTLTSIIFTAYPPAYTGLKPAPLTGNALTLLRGTRVEITAQANAPLNQGQVVVGTETVAVEIDPAQPQKFRARFQVQRDAEGIVALARGRDRLLPVYRFQLRARSDEPPLVQLFLPGRDIDLPLNMQVPLGINSIDDFGLSAVWLHYGRDSFDRAVIIRRLNGAHEDTTFYLWDLTGIGLVPGDQLRYYVRAVDNDAVSGPKSSRSEIYTIRFPTMTEIYEQAVQQTTTTLDQLQPLQSEQAKLGTELSRIAEELKKRRELSWEEQKRLEMIASNQQNLLQQIQELQAQVARTSSELLAGMNWDQKTLERLNQLQELLSRLLPENLQQALKELSQKLSAGKNFQPVLERLQAEQERLKKGIEQALELLNRIKEEVQLEALQRQAEELARQQQELTRHLDRQPPTQLAPRQQEINAGIDSLQQGLKELSQNFSEPAVADSLAELASRLNHEPLTELAHNLAEQLRAGNRTAARAGSEKLTQSLRQLAEQLDRLGTNLKQSRSREIVRQLFTGAAGLLTISEQQEQLEAELRAGATLGSISARQQSLLEATKLVAESLAGLGARTLAVPPALDQELARAMNLMRTASEQAATGSGYALLGYLRQARQSLNQAVALLLEAGTRAQPGSGLAGGLQDLLEQLSRMTSEQLAINAGMSGLPIPIPASGLSAQQLEQLNRLLAQQQALRQQLEELLRSMGGERPGLTGALEALIEEMKAVERSLAELQVDRKLIERQQGIVTRLLDTQRSLRQQGFKEQRQAQTAQPYQPQPPSALPLDRGERNRLLRAELLRALKQGYPAEYEALIRAYFEMLLQREQ
ncbi:MAG: hypothetical protein ACP5JB_05140 [candidate division WOR-3 bacterium]|jgi:predicted  nucleic acid-binding Zn-ribbon protein